MEPGDRAAAPGPLRLVQAFVNTVDREDGPDHLADPASFGRWLEGRGASRSPRLRVTEAELGQAVALREALRDLLAVHNALPADAGAARATVEAAGARARLTLVLDGPGRRCPARARGRRRPRHDRRGRARGDGRRLMEPAEGLRARALPLGVLRRLAQPLEPLVLDGGLRRAREEPPRLLARAGGRRLSRERALPVAHGQEVHAREPARRRRTSCASGPAPCGAGPAAWPGSSSPRRGPSPR